MSGGRTGQVFIESFDVGVATTMGGELVEVTLDGERVQAYAVKIDGVNGPDEYNGLIPISMSEPEDSYQDHLLPQIVISRGAILPQMTRWFPGGFEYQVPASNAKQVDGPGGVKMPDRIEKKWWTYPYEITYDIQLRSRLRVQADRMLRHVGRFFWAYGDVFLTDSEGDKRSYAAFVDSYDNASELADVGDRLQGHIFSLRVEGELDFNEPFLMPTTPKFTTRVGRL